MNYAVTGNKLFVINEDRVVSRVDGKPTGLVETDKTITIALYGFIREVEKEWLYWLSYFKLDMPIGYEDRVFDIEFKDYFSLRHMRVDPKMVIFKKPVYLIQNNNFRLIARFPKFAISTAGVVYNTRLDRYYKPLVYNNTYSVVNLVDQAGLYNITKQMTHRLVAMTWIANDDYTKNYLVDHIDGNKTNCYYTNLRWVDHAYNNLAKAYQGLNTQAIAVKIRDIDTGEINSFPSLTEACRYMERAYTDTKSTPLRADKIWHTKKGRYEIKYATDDTPWYYENKDIGKSVNQKLRITITRENGDVIVVNNRDEYKDAIFNGTKSAWSMAELVQRHKAMYPKDKIVVEKLSNYNDTEIVYLGKNIHTDELVSTNDRKTLIDKTGVSKSSIQKSIANEGAYQYNGWVFKVDNHLPFAKVLNSNNSNSGVKIIRTNILDGTTIEYASLRSAGEALRIDKKTVSNAIDNNNLLFGKFKFTRSVQ